MQADIAVLQDPKSGRGVSNGPPSAPPRLRAKPKRPEHPPRPPRKLDGSRIPDLRQGRLVRDGTRPTLRVPPARTRVPPASRARRWKPPPSRDHGRSPTPPPGR